VMEMVKTENEHTVVVVKETDILKKKNI
jgi:hypothetical protein